MIKNKRWALVAVIVMIAAIALAACQPETVTEVVEVTRVVTETETIEVEGEPVEVTRVVVETVEVEVPVEAEEEMEEEGPKNLIVCMAQEPETLYVYGGSMLVQAAVTHGFYEDPYTTMSYAYQADGLEKLPSIADGDAVLETVDVVAGDIVLDAVSGEPVPLEAGVMVDTVDSEENVEYDGTSTLQMERMVVDFTMKPWVWEDGTPVTADDSVYGFELVSDPDTPASKFTTDRTASYEATGDLSTRWTGIPGYRDSVYFTNFWTPLPRHAWGSFTAAELVEAEESNRMPLSNGPFRIQEWIAGDSITLVRNENYYRADEVLVDSVTFKIIPDTNQLIAQLLAGQCDIGTQDGMDVGQAPFLIEAEANGLLVPYFQTGTVYEHIDFGINSYGEFSGSRPDWFEDVRVRTAMTMCTDRQSMVDNILFGRSEVIHTYIPSVHPLYPEGLNEIPFDVEGANAMLDEVGFLDTDGDGIREYNSANVPFNEGGPEFDGTPFNVSLGTTAGNEMRQQLTQIFQENMLQCGINVELFFEPSSEWFADGPEGTLFGRKFDLGEFAWLTGVDPACNLYLTSQIAGPVEEGFGGWGAANAAGWSNADFDAVCNAALGNLPGTAEYEENHKEAQRIFSQEVPVIPLFLRLKVAAARNEVCNFSVDPTQNSELVNLENIGLGNCE